MAKEPEPEVKESEADFLIARMEEIVGELRGITDDTSAVLEELKRKIH